MHHFRTKEAPLTVVIEEADERDRYVLDVEDLHQLRGLAVFDALDKLVQVHSQRRAVVQLGHLLRAVSTGGEHVASHASREHFIVARNIIRSSLIAGIEDGEVDPGANVEMIAQLAVATMEGLESQWLSDPDAVDIVTAYRTFAMELREMLRRSPTTDTRD